MQRRTGAWTRRALLLGLLLASLVLALPVRPAVRAQTTSALLPYPVAIAPGNQRWPAVDGDFVVWFDEMEERPAIRANDLRSGAEFRLSREGSLPVGPPAISGSFVVWADHRGETPTTPFPEPHINLYDLRTHRDYILSPVEGRQVEPRISGTLVVWTDYREHPQRGRIYAYDLETRREFPLSDSPAAQSQPDISGTIAVWREESADGARIMATDVRAGTVSVLTPQPGTYERPLVSGTRVVWLDTTGGAPRIAQYDLGASSPLPSLAGRRVLALDGDRLLLQDVAGEGIVLHDLSSGAETPVARVPARAPEVWASLGGGTLAWTDYRNSELHWNPQAERVSNTDIFVARLQPPPIPSGPRPNLPYRAASPEYGMNLFVWRAPDVTNAHLRRLTAAGFTWQKTRIPWAEVETRKGQFNWEETDRVIRASNDLGVKVIARVDVAPAWARPDGNPHGPPLNFDDYGDFIYALVNRYRTDSPYGRLHAIEVWNEPNLHKEWGNLPVNRQQAAEYVRLLQVAYQAAKRADPNVTVVSGSLSPTGWNDDTARPDDVYLHWMYQAGAAAWFDALGVHGAGYGSPPETVPMSLARYPHPSFYFRRAEQLREIMVQYGDADKQIWMMEFGWTTDPINPAYAWYRVSEEQKGEYLVRAYRMAREQWAPWIGVMVLWTMPDPRWTSQQEEYWWAILDPDGTERESYRRLLEAHQNGLLPQP
ncbi:MAG: cellulase family glycosylhydrolase [Chloroflexi bacterium]|nr:cellulase family glycosylhydrolase [Chloroflexota bacterium]